MLFGLEMFKHFLPFLDPDAEEDINKLMEEMLEYCMTWNHHPSWEWVRNTFFISRFVVFPTRFSLQVTVPFIFRRWLDYCLLQHGICLEEWTGHHIFQRFTPVWLRILSCLFTSKEKVNMVPLIVLLSLSTHAELRD